MPNIAQQDYIIIDWEGKTTSDATKKAEVDAQLKNIWYANPLALFSVLFANYGLDSGKYDSLGRVYSFSLDDPNDPGNIVIGFSDPSNDGLPANYEFSI